ncbi:hypothetical protein ACGH7X_34460 [Streptomyces sp. BBFR51]|uniref:hypothetical protein n=1 Tax=Streptomyces sp. BBFR51 TaxID=3372856 RepID=UPI0037DD428E
MKDELSNGPTLLFCRQLDAVAVPLAALEFRSGRLTLRGVGVRDAQRDVEWLVTVGSGIGGKDFDSGVRSRAGGDAKVVVRVQLG